MGRHVDIYPADALSLAQSRLFPPRRADDMHGRGSFGERTGCDCLFCGQSFVERLATAEATKIKFGLED